MDTLTIGNFDGVHAGHRALVALAREAAGDRGRTVAVTFEPLPAARLRPESAPPRLTTPEERRSLLRAAGADEVIELEPTPDLLGRSPESFLAGLRERVPFAAIVEGPDFRFGKGRVGDLDALREIGRREGFRVLSLPPVEIELADLTVVRAASSLVRWLLAMGRVADAARVLGRDHAVAGVTASGDRRGRTLGFPTANLAEGSWGGTLLPADGVYAGAATLPDGRVVPAAISIGTKPTFGPTFGPAFGPTSGGTGDRRTCEAHFPGVELPTDWYGWPLRLSFARWIRGQMRFSGPEAIAARIARDLAETTAVPAASRAPEGACA